MGHGDVHEWNALESDRGYLLVDPDGLQPVGDHMVHAAETIAADHAHSV